MAIKPGLVGASGGICGLGGWTVGAYRFAPPMMSAGLPVFITATFVVLAIMLPPLDVPNIWSSILYHAIPFSAAWAMSSLVWIRGSRPLSH